MASPTDTQLARVVNLTYDLTALKTPTVIETEVSSTPTSARSEYGDSVERDASDWIVSSPYFDPTHHLDLRTLSSEYAAFASALTVMDATRDDYATAPYASAFNWDEIVSKYHNDSRQTSHSWPSTTRFFVIVFRSRLKVHADRPLLGVLDKAAHLEAVEGGGLLKYWFGTPDKNRRNLATCLWRARSDARLGGAGPGHAAAMTAARRMYDEWIVERLQLTVDHEMKTWSFEPWPESD